MEEGFFVVERRICEACNGSGVVMDSNWEAFSQWQREKMAQLGYPNVNDFDRKYHEEIRAWWHQRGYDVRYVDRQNNWCFEGFPPEERECFECDGAGKIVRDVQLLEALEELGVTNE